MRTTAEWYKRTSADTTVASAPLREQVRSGADSVAADMRHAVAGTAMMIRGAAIRFRKKFPVPGARGPQS